MKAFVTDGDERPALAITRSLGRRGISVLVGEERPASLAGSSRYCTDRIRYPSPYRQPARFAEFLEDLVRRERIDVVIPVSDVTTYSVAGLRGALAPFTATATPPLEAFERTADKHQLIERAKECGIPVPGTRAVGGEGDLSGALPHIAYPAVLKPVCSRILTSQGWLTTSVHIAHDERELLRLYRRTPYLASHPSLIQERIVGHGIGVFVLCDRGRVLTTFAHRRLREKPPSGGVSVLSESLAVDPVLRAQAERLLEPLGWRGVAMLEYKHDRRTGRAVLMEVNGRFWGSLQLAIDAGVDFPYLTWQLALGRAVHAPGSYAVGIRNRWLLGDLDHLLCRLLHGDRDLPEDAPSKLQAIVQFATTWTSPRLRGEILRMDDPRPAVRELGRYGRATVGA